MFGHHRHHHHRGPFGHGGPRHGRGGRMFQHGDLRLLILALIAEAPRHGYELIREIEARLGGAYAPSPGVVYPTLTLLEEQGLVTAQATEGNKRQYTVTEAGTAHLAEHQATVDAIFARIEEAGGPGDFSAPHPARHGQSAFRPEAQDGPRRARRGPGGQDRRRARRRRAGDRAELAAAPRAD